MKANTLLRLLGKDADPMWPYDDTPEDNWATKPSWTPRRRKWWVESQQLGIQYYTGYGPVLCPERNWK